MRDRTGERRTAPRQARGTARFSASGFLTPTLIGLLCLALLVAALERGRGHYHRLRSRVVEDDPGVAAPAGPGGQPALVIRRTATASRQPEFLSATMLPGRGMNVLQLTAMIPGHGEQPLLFSPGIAELSQVLTASGPDAYGAMSATFGGAIALPWAGQLTGVLTANRSMLQGVWQGQRLTYPAAAQNSSSSTEGLLLARGADNVETSSVPGGKAVQSTFHAGSFGGSWPSTLEVSVADELTAHDFDLSIHVKNTGRAASPVGIGWHPYFALAASDRRSTLLSIPSTQQLNAGDGAGTAADFSSPRGTPLGVANLNTTYTHLQHGILADGPVIELRNVAEGYALRLTLLTDSIRFLHVTAPADKPWIAMEPATNAGNALARGAADSGAGGLQTLEPGDSLNWHVRLDILPLP